MKIKHAAWAVTAVAAILSAPVFAQTAVVSATGPTVTSGTGIVVTPGVPALAPAVVQAPGAMVAQAGSTTSVNGNTTTTVTRYWVNVPGDVQRDASFQRWQALR